MKNIAVFGGSFNPIHNGHINLINQVKAQIDFDEILLIPSKIPPHKSSKAMVSGEHRFEMCKIASKLIGENVKVSDIELKQNEVSYSVNTLQRLKELYPNDKLWFIMGSDMLLCFDKWYQYEKILQLTNVLAAARNDGEYLKLVDKATSLKQTNKNAIIEVVGIDVMCLSSTQVRDMIKNSNDVSELIPMGVLEYIKKHKLYI